MKRLLALIAFVWIALIGTSHAQVNQVYSATTPSCENASAYGCATAAWRPASPAPPLVASGRTASCRWGSTPILWTKPANLQPTWCVSFGSTNGFVAASTLGWPPSTTPPPVNCVVSEWSEWSIGPFSACIDGTRSRTDQRTRTVVTPASGGGTACPALVESRTVSDPTCAPPDPRMDYFRIASVSTAGPAKIWTYESITVEWSSRDAATCLSSWGGTVGTSGSATTGPYTFAISDINLNVICSNTIGRETYGGAHFEVKSKVPPCKPGISEIVALLSNADHPKVAVARLQAPDPVYTLKVLFYCASPTGPVKYAYATNWKKLFDEGMKQRAGTYDDNAVNEECERTCVPVLPDGPVKDEIDLWSLAFMASELGVIGE